MFVLLTLLSSLLLVDASPRIEGHHCQPLAPATNMVALFMTIGNRYLYAQHRFGAPLVSAKCWSDSAFFVEYNIFDNSMHHNFTLYDRKEGERIKRVKCSLIGNSSKLYTIFEGREMVQTMIVVNPEYMVNHVCSGTEGSKTDTWRYKLTEFELQSRSPLPSQRIFTTMFALLAFLSSLLVASANNSTGTYRCQPLEAASSMIRELFMVGNRYLYAQHRFGPPIISEKCWSSSFFFSDYNIIDNSLHHKWTFYDDRNCPRTENVTCSTIEYKSKYYNIFHDAVEIFTIRKFRDEKVIQHAIEAARKIVDLPSPSVNLECNKLVT
nr:unnamed protein product [Callosobruchus chinensis]